MFRREWLQSSRISVLELAYISVGKDPDLAQSMEKPELRRHQILKDAIADGALTSCGERYPYPRMPDVPHGGSLLRFDDLVDYAKTVSFGWLDDLLRLWTAVRAGAPQDEMEEIFTSLRLDVEGLASDWRSLQSPDNETTLIAVPEGAPDSDTAQSDAIDVDTPGSDQTDVDALSPREKRKRKTAETYKRWYLRSKKLKSERRLTRRSEIARQIAKEEPDTTSENIRRRLSAEYPTWPD